MEPTLLALDCGTQSLRALLFSRKGELLDKVKRDYEPYVSPSPDWAEQDPELCWRCLCETGQELKAKAPEAFARIHGVGVTTRRDSLVFVDAEGKPLRPAVLWLDTHQAAQLPRTVHG